MFNLLAYNPAVIDRGFHTCPPYGSEFPCGIMNGNLKLGAKVQLVILSWMLECANFNQTGLLHNGSDMIVASPYQALNDRLRWEKAYLQKKIIGPMN